MTIVDGLILGIVQGLTEFIPVSSSGHLILMRDVLGLNTRGGLAFDAVLQLGTALAVLVYFRSSVGEIFSNIWKLIRRQSIPQDDMRLLKALAYGTIPAVVLGLALEDAMESIFRNAMLVALSLIAGSILFIFAERRATQRDASPDEKRGFWIGVFQSLALIPGMSRSGSTISGGLIFGLTRDAAARFSFLLSLPIIGGSGLKKLLDVTTGTYTDIYPASLVAGFIAAALVGLACIHWLLKFLKHHSLVVFAWYRIALALLVFALTL